MSRTKYLPDIDEDMLSTIDFTFFFAQKNALNKVS